MSVWMDAWTDGWTDGRMEHVHVRAVRVERVRRSGSGSVGRPSSPLAGN